MTTLDPETITRIESEALKLFPVSPYRGPDFPKTVMDKNEFERDLWKQGATAEALRYKACVDALERIKLLEGIHNPGSDCWKIATTTLNNLK